MSKKRGDRRGQVTIFMILALIILAVGSIFFFASRPEGLGGEYVQPELVPVKNYVES